MALTIQERTNLIKLTVGMFNAAPGAIYLNELATVFEANGRSYTNLASILSNSIIYQSINPASQTSQDFAASFLTPFGLQGNTEAVDFIVARLNAGANKGALVVQALIALDGSTNPVFANAKAILNNKSAVAENYSVTLAKNETSLAALKAAIATVTGDVATVAIAIAANTAGAGNEAGVSLVLTVGQDLFTGGTGQDFFRAVAGQNINNQDQTTLNSSDIIDGAGNLLDKPDTLIVNLNGNYGGGARIKNIETLQVGSNVQGTVAFDYNVNQGQNEITEVTRIVADQINLGEQLNVGNILATTITTAAVAAVAAVPATGTTPAIPAVLAVPAGTSTFIPTLAWTNEAGSVAGTASFGFRESAVAGPTVASIELNNVNAVAVNATTGRLVLGGGVETVTIASNGGPGATTLNVSTNVDGNVADIVSGSNDLVNDNGALTTVIVTGTRTFGKAATVNIDDSVGQASFGLTNRVANGATDLGTDNTGGSASNLVSVAGTVTLVNATAASGGVNMRFLSKADNVTLTAVTFQGGAGADYVEFEQGAVNATGGAGNDTFAFVNSLRTSFDFGSNDTLVGGEGDDTIQIGLNGVGIQTLNTTEFNNKTGIETLDLRAAINTVTLADAFVAGVDAGKTLTVRTDKIVQISDASTANTSPTLAANNAVLENNAISTVVLTQLAGNRAINFLGGSGSDRLVVSDASANQFSNLDGGTSAAVNSFDSLTVVNTSVLDSNDVRNIKNFELLNLVENVSGNNTFNIDISETFLNANTTAANTLTIASVQNTYGTRLGAGDVVNLEVSNLLTGGLGTPAKASILGKIVNVQDLVAAGVSVNYLVNGVVSNSVAVAGGALVANINSITAPAGTLVNNVPGVLPINLIAGGIFTGTANVNDNFIGTNASLNGTTVTGTAADIETLTITDAANVTIGNGTTGGIVTNMDILSLGNFANNVSFGGNTGFTTVNGGTLVDTINIANLASPAVNVNLGAGNDFLTLGNLVYTATIEGGAGTDTLSTISGAFTTNLQGATVTGFETLSLGGTAATAIFGANSLLNQFTTIADTGATSSVLNIAAGVHNISNATVTGFNIGAVNTVTVAAGASLTIAGDSQFGIGGGTDFTGTGTLTTTGNLTFAGGDIFSGTVVLDSASAVTYVDGGAAGNVIRVAAAGTTSTVAKAITLVAGGTTDTLFIDALGADALTTVTGFTTGAGNDVLNLSNVAAAGVTRIPGALVGAIITPANNIASAADITSIVTLSVATSQVTGLLSAVGVGDISVGSVRERIVAGDLETGAAGGTGFIYVALDDGANTGIYRLQYTDSIDAGTRINNVSEITSLVHVATLVGVADAANLAQVNLA